MVLIDKQTLIYWMLLDSLSKETHYIEKIKIFENKIEIYLPFPTIDMNIVKAM